MIAAAGTRRRRGVAKRAVGVREGGKPISPAPLAWSAPLIAERHRFKVLYGGRASGKTWQVAFALLWLGMRRKMRIVCAREKQKSIRESAKRTLELWIDKLGWAGRLYHVERDYILGTNGTTIFFHGLSTVHEEEIRGWESVDIVWVEEAHTMSARSREILYPTIRREGSELWFTFNPRHRHDPVYRDFVANPRPGAWVKKINYTDNLHLSPEIEAERDVCRALEPDRFPHIWLGEPDDGGAERQVLPYGLLALCVERWDKRHVEGFAEAGLDVADRGPDYSALAVRRGPAVVHVERWHTDDIARTASRAVQCMDEHDARMLFWDEGGIGGALRHVWGSGHDRAWSQQGVHFGGRVQAPDKRYSRRYLQKDAFSNHGSQLAWVLRLRAQATQQGDDPSRCLFIDPGLPHVDDLLAELARPVWEERSGQVHVVKAQDEDPSPDRFDALRLAFASDCRHGVRAGVGSLEPVAGIAS